MCLARLHASWQLDRTALVEHGLARNFHRRRPSPARMSLADMTSKHLREIISSVPLPHPAQIARRRARTASAATGRRPLVGVPTCRLFCRGSQLLDGSRAASTEISIEWGITCSVAPTISCNRREPGINSAPARLPRNLLAPSRLQGVAPLRATLHFINGQTARMFLHTHRSRVFRSAPSGLSADLSGIIAASSAPPCWQTRPTAADTALDRAQPQRCHGRPVGKA
jgi:hypothetical protein